LANEPANKRLTQGDSPMNSKTMMKLVAVIQFGDGDNKRNRWNNIGIAWANRDGSFNLKFDYLPADMTRTTIQMRPYDRNDDTPASE
jgi:hypothetical protein